MVFPVIAVAVLVSLRPHGHPAVCAPDDALQEVLPFMSWVESDVKEASHQLGGAPDPAYRVLILDVTEAIGTINTELRSPPSLDPIPESVLAISSRVEGALRGNKNKGVELALVVWDDHIERGSPPQGGTLLILRRRTHVLVHPAQRGKVREPNRFFDGFSVVALVLWQARPGSPPEGRRWSP